MDYGVKVTKAGHSVANLDAPTKSNSEPLETVEEMVSALSLASTLGAPQQIERYKEAYVRMKTNPRQAGVGSMYCLHEALALLEDLDTLSSYTQKCGETHELNKTIRNMRSHARHDIRENIDHESNDGRRKRAKQLGVHANLLVHIGFDENAIKMGSTVLTLDEATQYIEWATNILTKIMEGAIEAGRMITE